MDPTPLDYIMIGVGLFCVSCLSGWACYGVCLMIQDARDWFRGRN